MKQHSPTLSDLCAKYDLPAHLWYKPRYADAIRRLPDMKPEAREYMVKLIREARLK